MPLAPLKTSTTKRQKRAGPLYLQAAQALEEHIRSAEFAAGGYLPSERELCSLLGVSRITVRKSLEHLEERKLVIREPQRGTRILNPIEQEVTVELMLLKWSNPFMDPILGDFCAGVLAEAEGQGVKTMLSYISDEFATARHRDRIRNVRSGQGLDGLIVTGDCTIFRDLVPEMEKRIPLLLAGTPYGAASADVLAPDYENAMHLAVEHARRMGYAKILHVGGAFRHEDESRDSRNEKAFLQAAERFGYASGEYFLAMDDPRDVRDPFPSPNAGFRIPRAMYDGVAPSVAVIAAGPTYAVQCYRLAVEKGFRVPEEIGILSVEDGRKLQAHSGPITAVRIMGEEAGRLATNRLLQRLRHPKTPRMMGNAPVSLVIRGSCGEGRSVENGGASVVHPTSRDKEELDGYMKG